jgi:hypothetical protein
MENSVIMKTLEEVGRQLQQKHGEEPIPCSDLVKEVATKCECSPGSVLPSDYCYNLWNEGIPLDHPRFFLHKGEKRSGLYVFKGRNFTYYGPIYHYPKGHKGSPIVISGSFNEGVYFNDIDVHEPTAKEGNRKLTNHLCCERNQSIVRAKKNAAPDLKCQVCGFSFEEFYGERAKEYCEVHHLIPLAQLKESTETHLEDLAILCANCHRVVHLTNPPCALDDLSEIVRRNKN